MNTRIAIFEDNAQLREMLAILINECVGYQCCGAFSDASDLTYKIKRSEPDIVLMDIEMPGVNGIEATKRIKSEFPSIKILMQTVFEDDKKIFESICAGASGYILKNSTTLQLIEALKEVEKGGAPMSSSVARVVIDAFRTMSSFRADTNFNLSERETEVLEELGKGKSYKMIASSLDISIDTIKFHIKNIYHKLQVNSKSEAVIKAMKHNII